MRALDPAANAEIEPDFALGGATEVDRAVRLADNAFRLIQSHGVPRLVEKGRVAVTLVQGVRRTVTIAGFPLSAWAFALRIWTAMMFPIQSKLTASCRTSSSVRT